MILANKYVNINTGTVNENVPTKETLEAVLSAQKHSAYDITSGTLAVARGGTGQTSLGPAIGTVALRGIYAGTGAMTSGTTALTTGQIYLQYE